MTVWIVLPNCSKKKSTNTTPLPGAPTLISPSNRATGEAINPILEWHYGDGWYNGFILQIATDSSFTNLVINQAPSYTALIVEPVLNEYTKYFWRVKTTLGANPASTSNWSVVWSFTTGPGKVISSLKSKGSARSIAVKGSYSYLVSDSGFQVIDVSTPTSPSLVGSYLTTFGYLPKIALEGDCAYIIAGYSGLQIFNVSTPATPTLMGKYNNRGRARDIAVKGSYAYVTYELQGMMDVIDISNPSNPALAATWYIKQDTCWKGCPSYVWGVEVSGNHAYLATYYGLEVVDITNPVIPTLAGRYTDYSNPFDLAVASIFVYLPQAIIDVSNVAEPKKMGTYQYVGERMSLSDNRLFSLVHSGVPPYYSLRIHDISSPTSPTLTAKYNRAERAVGVDSLVYIAAGSDGLKVLQFSSPSQTLSHNFRSYSPPPPNTR